MKMFAYGGVPPHMSTDYFQMSKVLARACCDEYAVILKKVYDAEYLRTPTAEDLKMIVTLHKQRHKLKEYLDHWIACTLDGKFAQKGGKHLSRPEKRVVDRQ